MKDGGPAFPRTGMTYANGDCEYPENGMSLRQYYAGQALVGLMASFSGVDVGFPPPEKLAADAVMQADALLAALEADNG